jgi:hypothetical protein
VIFISYRRSDSDGAGRVTDGLRAEFGDAVYSDVEGIAPGANFAEALKTSIERAKVVLIVIGPTWLQASDEDGHRPLDQPDDWVRIEIETALRRSSTDPSVLVVPVLVGGARMPSAEALPEGIRDLARRRAVELRNAHWPEDFKTLIRLLSDPSIGLKPGTSDIPASEQSATAAADHATTSETSGPPSPAIAQPQKSEAASPRAPRTAAFWARTSFLLGLLSLVLSILAGIPAILAGHRAFRLAKNPNQVFERRKQAIAGLILGYFTIAVTCLGLALELAPFMANYSLSSFSFFTNSKEKECASHLRQLGASAHVYSKNYNAFPPSLMALSHEMPAPQSLVCPEDRHKTVAPNWDVLRAENITYLYLLPRANAQSSLALPMILCPIHNLICLGDGSVQNSDRDNALVKDLDDSESGADPSPPTNAMPKPVPKY